MKFQLTSFTLLLLFALCLASVSAQSPCYTNYTNVTVTSDSKGVFFYPGDCFGDPSAYHLAFEYDCNLVLYDYQTPLWASASSWQDNDQDCFAYFQSDGNFGVYTSFTALVEAEINPDSGVSPVLWSSGTAAQIQEARLEIHNRQLYVREIYGNYSVYLDVSNPPPHTTPRPFRTSATPYILVKPTDISDFVFQEQQYMGDLDNTYVIFQDDCNFVLYDENSTLWSSGTARHVDYNCELAVKRDGSLVIYAQDNSNVVYWSWDGNSSENGENGETEGGGELVATELAVSDGLIQVVYTFADGFTSTFSTVNGNLTLID